MCEDTYTFTGSELIALQNLKGAKIELIYMDTVQTSGYFFPSKGAHGSHSCCDAQFLLNLNHTSKATLNNNNASCSGTGLNVVGTNPNTLGFVYSPYDPLDVYDSYTIQNQDVLGLLDANRKIPISLTRAQNGRIHSDVSWIRIMALDGTILFTETLRYRSIYLFDPVLSTVIDSGVLEDESYCANMNMSHDRYTDKILIVNTYIDQKLASCDYTWSSDQGKYGTLAGVTRLEVPNTEIGEIVTVTATVVDALWANANCSVTSVITIQ
jgi:hypothetical protein